METGTVETDRLGLEPLTAWYLAVASASLKIESLRGTFNNSPIEDAVRELMLVRTELLAERARAAKFAVERFGASEFNEMIQKLEKGIDPPGRVK